MPPKKQKAQKQSLGDFLANESLGSWADEMDSLPTAPAMRNDDDGGRSNDRYGRRDDFLSSRPDRAPPPPREDVPLPTQPPYTAFIGNLAFDLSEAELEDFFASSKTKSVKIIKDRDDKPKGFGYVEFEDLDGLKDALTKTGASLSGRNIRVSVAEAPKERSGFGPNADDGKFDNPWRREGPLPDAPSRDSSRRRFDSLPSVSEGNTDWRAGQRARPHPEPETPSGSMRRRNAGFGSDIPAGSADREESWTIGGKFKPSEDKESAPGSRFGSIRGKGDMGPPPSSAADEGDWRSMSRSRPATRGSTSPNGSTPPTPQRRKLELLPRSGNGSTVPSPLSSPKMGPSPSTAAVPARSNPFGAARPVDVTARETEVAQRVEKDREINRERLTMSRTSSRTGTERPPISRQPTNTSTPATPSSPKPSQAKANSSANVRPSFSFANAAANKGSAQEKKSDDTGKKDEVNTVTESIAEVTI
ncbi:RNA-binding domain-containing protein [Dendrothele bispora CBS 962.96]|uniref:RNA-binding domain-containing protein n=1 Tax=Dendrothele bispora (strain CBS 962.96) TaxID=1314807 RepID=A0A4S8MJG5_DENBC|nr:RNA-binding domain-containing protein [Dendrothele bispora CBS 962.96]